jgi:hypothetical protein
MKILLAGLRLLIGGHLQIHIYLAWVSLQHIFSSFVGLDFGLSSRDGFEELKAEV